MVQAASLAGDYIDLAPSDSDVEDGELPERDPQVQALVWSARHTASGCEAISCEAAPCRTEWLWYSTQLSGWQRSQPGGVAWRRAGTQTADQAQPAPSSLGRTIPRAAALAVAGPGTQRVSSSVACVVVPGLPSLVPCQRWTAMPTCMGQPPSCFTPSRGHTPPGTLPLLRVHSSVTGP